MNTPKPYWFKRRRYGYGWVPVTWQGWATLTGLLAMILLAAFSLGENPSTLDLILYLVNVAVLVAVLLVIVVKTGPEPKWRWGKKPTDDPDKDF